MLNHMWAIALLITVDRKSSLPSWLVYFILEGSSPTLVYGDEVLLRNVSSSSFSIKTTRLVLGRAQFQ